MSACSIVAQSVASSIGPEVGATHRIVAANTSTGRPLAAPPPVSPAHAVTGAVTEPGGLPEGYAPEGYVSPDWAYSGYLEPEPAAPCDESAGSRCDEAAATSAADER